MTPAHIYSTPRDPTPAPKSETLRLFYAIDLTRDLQDELQTIIARLQAELNAVHLKHMLHWVDPHDAHLTLHFIGTVRPREAPPIMEAIERGAHGHAAFEVPVGRFGGFPDLRRPRVLWVGVDRLPALMSLRADLEASVNALGYASEQRPFFPHLTLARISEPRNERERLALTDWAGSTQLDALAHALPVQRVVLYSSDLRPNGAQYSVVHTVDL